MIPLFNWTEAEAIPIALAEPDGGEILGLWRDEAGDRIACVVVWNRVHANGKRGWRPAAHALDGSSEVFPTHWVPVPKGF